MVKLKRKVIQIADSTQLVSLPRKWALKYGIKKGDEIDVEEQGNKLVVSKGDGQNKSMDIEVKIDNLDKDSLIFLLRGLYIRGYDQIRFFFDDPKIIHHRVNKKVTISSIIHKEITICPGLDIMQERGNSFLLKNISVSSAKDFDNILKRIFLLLIDAAHDLHLAAKDKDYVLLESFQDKHDNITRLMNYNLKVLNTIGHSKHKNTTLLSNVLSSFDVVTDILKNTARDIIESKIKMGPKALDILHKIEESINMYYDLFYNFSFEKTNEFIKARQDVLNSIKKQKDELSKDDIRIVVMVEHCLEILRDVSSSRMSMQY